MRLVLPALLVAFLFSPREALAYCRSTACRGDCPLGEDGCPLRGKPLFWDTSCVGFSLNRVGTQQLDLEDVRKVIRKSFAAWSDLPCDKGKASLTFEELDDVACKRSRYDEGGQNVNVVLFQDDDWNYRGEDGTLAKTTVTFDDATGEILDADIEVNAHNNDLTLGESEIAYDLQSIMTHEVGHFLGFSHSRDESAVMNPQYTPGTLGMRNLADDDRTVLCAAYPPGRSAACNPEPRGGLSDRCDFEPTYSCAACEVTPSSAVAPTLAFATFGVTALFGLARRRRYFARRSSSISY